MQDGRGKADRRTGILGLAFEHEVGVLDLGKLAADRRAVGRSGNHQHALPGQRLEPVIGGAQERAARAGEVVQELGGSGP